VDGGKALLEGGERRDAIGIHGVALDVEETELASEFVLRGEEGEGGGRNEEAAQEGRREGGQEEGGRR
jgi:hypothetical protein